jgi:hypothetical protein
MRKIAVALLLVFLPTKLLADNCGGFGDCFGTLQLALATAVGLAVLSLLLDCLPGIGTVKGLIEAYTGEDMVTRQKLENWERVVGVIPLGGAIIAGIIGGVGHALRYSDQIINIFKKNGKSIVEIFPNSDWTSIVGILKDSSIGKGNFGLGESNLGDAMQAGRSWVGNGYITASDGKTLISADGLRQFRPPTFKPRLGKIQANFERRNINKGPWQGNGHLDVIE